jgi:hypothetical protein
VTYTYGKTKADKARNLKTVTLKYTGGIWAATEDADVIFENGRITIGGLTAKTKYTLTANFSNQTEAREATMVKPSSKAVTTAKAV